ncbi:Hsp20/alpha crystallin family protein [Microbacterium sulfonylureivorans]|uniref:Hsp20/alpha crystallin family protein n=1 Tax=Microbacterium sulfonylureivorans TaxID=2486854 RepID=UPI0013DE9ED2|nr:Hsp20/alpha crystallin family protein [Microbacterium sulfonylureivorans]
MARNVVRFDPFAQLSALTRDLFDGAGLRASQGQLPTTDVYTEDDKALIVEAHLPNFEEKDVSVDVDRGALVIQAERRERDEDANKRYVMRESSTSFYRSILLPEQADEERITAEFDGDVLKVTVPLAETASPRKIAIGGAAA